MNAEIPPAGEPSGDQPLQELNPEQRASMKAQLRQLFGSEPPREMLDLAAARERQFEEARAAAQ